jgi:hypothetical protein
MMFEYWVDTDLKKLPTVRKLQNVFSQDSGANKIGVRVTDDGEEITLSGTVKASIVKPDGTTISVDGSKDGNKAWVILPSSAYSAVGRLGVFLKLLTGSDIATLGGIEATVYKSL